MLWYKSLVNCIYCVITFWYSCCSMCRSWNLAASDNDLWKLQYATFFGNTDNAPKTNSSKSYEEVEDTEHTSLREEVVSGSNIYWREAFKRAYIGM